MGIGIESSGCGKHGEVFVQCVIAWPFAGTVLTHIRFLLTSKPITDHALKVVAEDVVVSCGRNVEDTERRSARSSRHRTIQGAIRLSARVAEAIGRRVGASQGWQERGMGRPLRHGGAEKAPREAQTQGEGCLTPKTHRQWERRLASLRNMLSSLFLSPSAPHLSRALALFSSRGLQ